MLFCLNGIFLCQTNFLPNVFTYISSIFTHHLCHYFKNFFILILNLLTHSCICSFSITHCLQNVKLKECFRKLNTITSCILSPKASFLIYLFMHISHWSEILTKKKQNWKVKNDYQCCIRKLNIFIRFNIYENWVSSHKTHIGITEKISSVRCYL